MSEENEPQNLGRGPLDAFAKHPLFQHLIRNRVIARLHREHGMTRRHAADLVDGLDDDTVAFAAVEVGAEPPPERGGFLDWLQKNLPQILQIVSMIVSILLAI